MLALIRRTILWKGMKKAFVVLLIRVARLNRTWSVEATID